MPFYYDEGDIGGMGEIVGKGVKRQREPNWLDSFMQKSNNYFYKTANELAEKHHKKYEENNVEYAAYQNYIKDLPINYWENGRPTELFTKTGMDMLPSIAALFSSAVVTAVTKSPAVGLKTYQALTYPTVAGAEYEEAFDHIYNKSGDRQLAKEQASNSTALSLIALNTTERLSVGRYMKNIMPKEAQRLTRRSLFKNMYKKIADDKRLYYGATGLESAFREGTQEYIQYLAEVAISTGYKDETFLDLYDWQEAKQNLMGGALLGGAMGSVGVLRSGEAQQKASMEDMFKAARGEDISKPKGKPASDLGGVLFEDISPELRETKESLDAEPSTKGYLNEVISGGTGINEVAVNRNEIKGDNYKNLQNLIKRTEQFGDANKVEKLSFILEKEGKNILPNLNEEELNALNKELSSGLKYLNVDLSNAIDKRKNLAQDVVDKKIKINYRKDRSGKIQSGIGDTKISITEQQIINDLIKENKEKINEKYDGKPTQSQISNWLNTNLQVVIGKQGEEQVQKQIDVSPKVGQPSPADLSAALGRYGTTPSKKQPKISKPLPKKKESASAKAIEKQAAQQAQQVSESDIIASIDKIEGKESKPTQLKKWSRYKPKGKENFEVSSKGTALGKQFSAFNAKLSDGRTIEEAYQVGVKGYSSIKEGKGKPPKDKNIDTYTEYKKLWQQWAKENPRKMEDLISASKGKVLTDKFAKTDVSQARALAEIINETRDTRSIDDVFKFPSQTTEAQVDKDLLEQEVSKRLEKAVKGTKGDVPRDVLEKDIRKKLKERDEIAKLFEGESLDTPKKITDKPATIDKNKATQPYDILKEIIDDTSDQPFRPKDNRNVKLYVDATTVQNDPSKYKVGAYMVNKEYSSIYVGMMPLQDHPGDKYTKNPHTGANFSAIIAIMKKFEGYGGKIDLTTDVPFLSKVLNGMNPKGILGKDNMALWNQHKGEFLRLKKSITDADGSIKFLTIGSSKKAKDPRGKTKKQIQEIDRMKLAHSRAATTNFQSDSLSQQPKQIDKNKAKKAADIKMAEIERIKGVDIQSVGLPVKDGLERIGDIKIAKELQGQGLGENWVNSLKVRRKTQGRETIDIIAKPGSEGFWEKQGFRKIDFKKIWHTEKGQLFREVITDKDGNIKKVDGKEPTPMIFDLDDVTLEDLVAQTQATLKDKPISAIGKKLKKIKDKPKKIDEVQNNSVSKIRDALKSTSKGTINLSDEAAYNKSKKEFNEAYDELKKSSRITLEDFVHSMYRALRKLPKEIRQKIRDFLMKWARSKDTNIDSKISMSSKTFNIVELMGFGDKQKIRFTRELIDSGTVDKISSLLDSENDINTDDTTREGLDISDISDHNEIADNFTFEGYDFRGDQFFKFLETSDSKGWIDDKQVAKLMQAALTGDKNILLEHLKSKHNFIPKTIQEQNLVQSFFIKNQPINRTSGYEKASWWWANIDYNGNLVRNKNNKKLIPKIGGSPKFGKDIRSNTDLPKTLNMSFVDWALQQNKYDGDKIKISRIYLKDLVNVWVGKVNKSGSKYYGKPEFSDLTINKKSLVNVWDNIFANGSNKDKKGNPIIRTVAEIKGGGNSPSFIVARVPQKIIELSKDDSKIIEYFEKEIARGNLTLEMSEEFLDSVEELNNNGLNKYVMAQHITQHELMKRAHGAKYLMRTTDILHHMKRASLPYGEGIVPLGLGDNTIKIIDQTKVSIVNEDGVKTPMTEYIAGLEGLSRSDGATITDTETLDAIAKAVGREQLNNGLPLREVKTIMWYNSLNDKFANDNYPSVEYDGKPNWEGEHYLSVKHNEFVADEGYRFVDEKDNLIAYTIMEDNKVKIYDADDNRINRLFTLDEAKEPDGGSGSFKLNGRVATDILTLPEESTRVIKVPSQRSKNSASFPMTWLSKLNHPDFDKVRTEIENKLLDVATANVRAMFDARKNPEIMASLFSQLKANNTSFPNEIDLLIEPRPGEMISDGYMLPHIASGALEPVKNKLIRENAYKGRRYGFGNYPTIKPDYDGTKVLENNGIAISEDDTTMTNFVKKKLNLDVGLQGKDLQNAFKDAMLNLNQRGKGVYLLIGRQPVYKANGVTLAKITNIVPSGAGNVIWIHPELAAGPLQADADGDASIMQIMYFGENFKDESVVNAMLNSKKAFDKRAGFSRVEYFKKGQRNFPATSKKSIYQASSMLGKGLASQGIFTNAINFFEDMHFKEIKMNIGKQTIITRDPENSKVIMDYAPLNDDITQEMLNDARMGTLVNKQGKEWKKGEKYLMTSPLTQLEILLQASVDHAKELLLYDWGYNGYDFIIPKIFVQENGSPIGIRQSRTISRVLRKLLSYGNIRYGRDMDTRATKSIASMFDDSKSMYELGELSGKERGKVIADLANSRRIRFDKGEKKSKLNKATLPIDEIIFNNKLTSIEKILSIPHKEMLKYKKENPNDMVMNHPWEYSPHQIVNGLAKTQSDLLTLQKREEIFYPENESWKSKKEQADRWINQAGTEFYRVHARAVVYKKAVEQSLNSASYPYADEMLDFINKWYNEGDKKRKLKPFKDLTKEQQSYTTLRFLRGISVQETQIIKGVEKQSQAIVKNILATKDKIEQVESERAKKLLTNKLNSLRNKLDKITTKTYIEKQPRVRDIEKILPMQLMDADVWTTYANLAGPNIRASSNEPMPLSIRKDLEQYLTKDCG